MLLKNPSLCQIFQLSLLCLDIRATYIRISGWGRMRGAIRQLHIKFCFRVWQHVYARQNYCIKSYYVAWKQASPRFHAMCLPWWAHLGTILQARKAVNEAWLWLLSTRIWVLAGQKDGLWMPLVVWRIEDTNPTYIRGTTILNIVFRKLEMAPSQWRWFKISFTIF